MIKKWLHFVGLIVIIGIISPGCDEGDYPNEGPIPQSLLTPALVDFSQDDVDDVVDVALTEIPSPAPRDNGIPPTACDFVRFVRFKPLQNYSGNAQDADACFLMVPGVLEGANGFDYIGRNMVYIAKTQYNMNIEVWAMDRRNNCVEDLTGTQAAEASGDADIGQKLAIDYYYNGEEINGKAFHGFLKSSEVPFMSEFGLKMDTEDMFTIITTMVPDQETRKKKVFVGGHSLGGVHTSVFSGWDLDGDPSTLFDAGYNNTAGIFAFDSTLAPVDEMVDSVLSQYLCFVPDSIVGYGKEMTKVVYDSALYGLRKNLITRFVDGNLARIATGSPIDAEIMGVIEVVGLLAHMAPGAEHTAIREIPISKHMDETLRTYMAKDQDQKDSGIPSAMDFRFTNEALLGIFFDDDFSHMDMIKTSLGFLHGGPIVPKDPEMGFKGLYVPVDAGPDLGHLGQGPLYTWANFDTVANNDNPLHQDVDKTLTYTTMDDETADMPSFARAIYKGDTNLVEWYFSIRRMVDLMAVIMDYGKLYGLNYYHSDKIADLPQIEFPSGDGMFGSMSPFEAIVGFNHMDPMFASANTSSHRPNQVIYPLLDFAIQNIKK